MRGTVLFVDDEPSILKALERTFTDDEFRVLTAASGHAALEILDRQAVDVVVSDQVMPQMSGAELLALVSEKHPTTMRIMLTGLSDGDTVMEAVNRGEISRYITKPWDEEELRSALEQAICRKALEKEVTLLRSENAASDEQIERARRIASRLETPKPVGEILVELGQLARAEYERISRLHRARLDLGTILKDDGYLSVDDWNAYQEARKKAVPKSDRAILVDGGLVTEEQYLLAVASKHDIPMLDPDPSLVDTKLLSMSSIPFLRKNSALPLRIVDGSLTVVLADPLDQRVIDELARIFSVPVKPCGAPAQKIADVLTLLERPLDSGSLTPTLQYREIDDARSGEETGEGAVQIVDYLLLRAIELGASDLHIEPLSSKVRVRVRVDGVLRSLTDLPADFAPRLTARVKILAGADIAERRLHQDGRIFVRVGGREVDIRASTYASMFGETIVLRLLDRDRGLVPLDDLGFERGVLSLVRDVVLRSSTGIVLVTGPTGSGKTTTLYSFVDFVNGPGVKSITCEDPVEYVLDGVAQCSVNEKTGPSFAESLRAIVRQDPDVIVVGEIRDPVTARLAVEAALTGHKVFTSLHTEDAVGAVTRLVDLGVEPFLVASTLCGIIAQRLVGRICRHCVRPASPVREDLRFLSLEPRDFDGIEIVAGAGCPECGKTGLKGRLGIHEVLVPDDDFRDAILRRAASKDLRALARKLPGFQTLQEDGLVKAMDGKTTLEEVASGTPRDPDARKPRVLRDSLLS